MNRRLSAFLSFEYEELLQELLHQGYSPVKLEEIVPRQRHLFLRHDVDIDLGAALQIAEREQVLGVRATYYLLLSTNFYNLASAAGRGAVHTLLRRGHQVGLHFDASLYDDGDDERLEEAALRECSLLESIAESPVTSISFHRPHASLLNRSSRLAGRRHTYEPEFFSAIAYVSDSNGGWHHGHPLDHEALTKGTAIQLLTHPEWWVGVDRRTPVETITDQWQARCAQIRTDLAATVTAFRQHLEQ